MLVCDWTLERNEACAEEWKSLRKLPRLRRTSEHFSRAHSISTARPTTDRLPLPEWSGVTTPPLNLSLPQSVLPAENYAPRGRAPKAVAVQQAGMKL